MILFLTEEVGESNTTIQELRFYLVKFHHYF